MYYSLHILFCLNYAILLKYMNDEQANGSYKDQWGHCSSLHSLLVKSVFISAAYIAIYGHCHSFNNIEDIQLSNRVLC